MMFANVSDYLRSVTEHVGRAWNRFWFLPTDPLTLSVIRVLAGLIAFYTVLTFTPDLIAFFGPHGLLALENISRMQEPSYFSFSYFWLFDDPVQLQIAHWVGLTVLGMFTLGLFTRVTSVLSLVVMLAYFHRGFALMSEMEHILAFVMFYLCLGPSGEYFSLDRLLHKRRHPTPSNASLTFAKQPVVGHWSATVALRLIQIHLTIVYFMMVVAQLREDTWWDGTAVWWMAGRQNSAMIDLSFLHSAPFLVNLWTLGFVVFEICFGALAWNKILAPLMVVLSVFAWTSLGLITGMLPFAAIMIVAGLAFLSTGSMRTALESIGLKQQSQPIV
jgi:hypothetical protein